MCSGVENLPSNASRRRNYNRVRGCMVVPNVGNFRTFQAIEEKHVLAFFVVKDSVSEEGNEIDSVRLSVCFHLCNRVTFDLDLLPVYGSRPIPHPGLNDKVIVKVGGVAQWLERRSLVGDFPCPALDLQLMDDH